MASQSVVINPTPTAALLFRDSTICDGKAITLSASGGVEYSWMPSQYLSATNTQTVQATPREYVRYIVTVKNAFGCADTASVSLKVVKLPSVNAGEDRTIIAGKLIQLNGKIDGVADSYEWSPNVFISNVGLLNPTVNPPADIQYILTAKAPNNCGVVSDSMQIKIFNGIFIPNAFSPNADGKNDTWNVPALEAYPLHTLQIYNRYGQLVFERKQSFAPWTGSFKGAALPNGAYTYVIDLNNGSPILKGSVLLLR